MSIIQICYTLELEDSGRVDECNFTRTKESGNNEMEDFDKTKNPSLLTLLLSQRGRNRCSLS